MNIRVITLEMPLRALDSPGGGQAEDFRDSEGMARPWLTAPCLLQHVPQATGDSNAPNPASVIMVEPATPRMGAVSALQAGLDPDAWKVATEGGLSVSTTASI